MKDPDGSPYALIAPSVEQGFPILQPPGGKVPDDVIGVVIDRRTGPIAGALMKLNVEFQPVPQGAKAWVSGRLIAADANVTVVQKLGRDVTKGTVESVNATVQIDVGSTLLTNAILVRGDGGPFSEPGDAGAPVVVDKGEFSVL
ncbi:MAG TPA: hypothetical protein VFG04_13940, partial [Planctomycetaceae bacterium]|nr:hypothetical protein [Planctomycetaceae bacterium]